MRAAIYTRYSTDLQNARSIEDQLALCRAFAAREGLTIVATYEDRALSGASLLGRDGVWQMLAAAQAGQFKVLVVEELDRLSRNMADLASLHDRLRFIGCEIRSVHSGTADTVQVGIRGLLGQLFLQDLRNKVRRGLAGVVREGRYAGGRPYGYRTRPGHAGEMTIDEGEAAVIRAIFTAYAAGDAPRTIAGRLNAEGVPAPRGARWNASTLNGNGARGYGILFNPVYGGRIVWNRTTFIKNPETGRRVPRVNADAEWQEAEAPHLRIVPEELRRQVLERREARTAPGTRNGHKHTRLLSGLLRCASCGGGMTSQGRDKPGQPTRIACSVARESGSCTARRKVPLPPVEAAVLEGLRTALADRRAIALYVRTYNEERQRLLADSTSERARLESQKARATASLARARDLAVSGILTRDEAAEKIAALRAEVAGLESALANLAAAPVLRIDGGMIAGYLEAVATLGETLATTGNSAARQLVRGMITSVTVETTSMAITVDGAIAAFGGDDGSGGAIRSSSPKFPFRFTAAA